MLIQRSNVSKWFFICSVFDILMSLIVCVHGSYAWEGRHKLNSLGAHAIALEKTQSDDAPPGSRTSLMTCLSLIWDCWSQEKQLRIWITGGCWQCIVLCTHIIALYYTSSLFVCLYWSVKLCLMINLGIGKKRLNVGSKFLRTGLGFRLRSIVVKIGSQFTKLS